MRLFYGGRRDFGRALSQKVATKTAANRSCERVMRHYLYDRNFLLCRTAKFLGTVCHHFVSTDLDFTPSGSGKISTIDKKTKFS
jgi:hypothetical protein